MGTGVFTKFRELTSQKGANDNRKMTETDGSSEPVILATAGYDHAIKFWQAHSGICHRTVQHPDSVSFMKNK